MRLKPNRGGRGQAEASSVSLPTATDGWNTIKNLGQMKPTEAIILDNWFPEETQIKIRPGSMNHCTGLGGPVDTIHGYASATSDILLAAANGHIYNANGASPSSLAAGFANNQWQAVNFGTDGGSFSLLANGVDGPQLYNGAALTTNNLTGEGLTTTNLIHVNIFKERPFYVEKNSLAFWYMQNVKNVSGPMSRYNLGSFCRLGGYLMAMATWTRDGGSGIDDVACFITSKGEVLIFEGDDPGDSSRWALHGVYRIGAPLGRRCFFKFANDVVVLTQDGFVPMGSVLSRDRTGLSTEALSRNIAPTVTQVASLYLNTFGWSGMLYPGGRMGIINVPLGNQYYQYVINTNTRAWCRFTNLNARSWGMSAEIPYFGDALGNVVQFGSGLSDNNAPVQALYKSSFQYFGNRNEVKHFNQVRPVFVSDQNIQFGYGIDVDFDESLVNTIVSGTAGGTQWNVGQWDSFQWSRSPTTYQNWQGATEIGRCASLKINIANSAFQISHLSTDWMWKEGGIM